jgi:large subunit ribosomal protein L46
MLRHTLKRGFATSVSKPLIVKNNVIQASVILSRTPQITRDATPFEKAYFDYREKLERQQAEGLPTEFYFKKGSVAERRWKHDEQARQEAMKDGAMSLTEAIEQSQISWEKENESLTATTKVEKKCRETEADKKDDKKNLDRALKQTLYLVVKKTGNDPWQFPQGAVDSNEYLHEVKIRCFRKEQCVLTRFLKNMIGCRAYINGRMW